MGEQLGLRSCFDFIDWPVHSNDRATDGSAADILAHVRRVAIRARRRIPETSTADLRATIQLQIGGELRKT